ncbi:MAG: hydrolase [Rhodopirellula sp.]|nr:hydrolase [Rhodopirellula sp.]
MATPPRSSELMTPEDTGLLVVDLQEKLVPVITDHTTITWNVSRLLRAAHALDVPTAATEQYPQGLGDTVDMGEYQPKDVVEKLMFSCREADDIFRDWAEGSIRKILICGIETHVCIQQTVLDLLSEGFRVYLAVDAIGARHALDHQIALRRMESSGAVLTTTEAAMFEWCESAANPKFKTISHLVREARPTDAE